MKTRIVVIGKAGSGKGTYAQRLCPKINIPQIASGDLLREAITQNTELGIEAKSYMDKGDLVPMEIVNKLLKQRLERDDCKNGFLLDGYPRSLEQAKALEEKCIKAGWKPIKHIWNIAHPLEPLIKKKASSLNKKLI